MQEWFNTDKSVNIIHQINKMKEEKRTDYPSPEETRNTPLRPSNRMLTRTVDYWVGLSLELLNKGDYNTSLLIPISLSSS